MEFIKYEKNNHIALISINRPRALNAFCGQLVGEFRQALAEIDADRDVYVTVVNSLCPKAFTAGGDIKEEAQLTGETSAAFCENGKGLMRDIITNRTPVILAVNRFALGAALEMILAADITVAANDAKIGMPIVTYGSVPAFGCIKMLVDKVGRSEAADILYTGRMLTAEEALRKGLIQYMVEPEELMDRAMDLARELASKPPLGLWGMKDVMNKSVEMSLEDAWKYETEVFAKCSDTEDRKEALSAFLEKRKPGEFQGR